MMVFIQNIFKNMIILADLITNFIVVNLYMLYTAFLKIIKLDLLLKTLINLINILNSESPELDIQRQQKV